MSTKLQIPMLDTFYEELDDAFIDEKQTAHEFIWEQLRGLCRDAKMGKLQKSCVVNVMKNGQPTQEVIKLRGLELKELASDPSWKPDKVEADEIKFFEHSVTDKTLKYLQLFASFSLLRHEKYGESIVNENKEKLAKLMLDKADQKIIDDARKTYEDAEKLTSRPAGLWRFAEFRRTRLLNA